MKFIVIVCFLLSALAQGATVGIVNVRKVLATVKQGKGIIDEVNKEKDRRGKILEREQGVVQKLQEDFGKLRENFEKQRLVLSEEKKAEQIRLLQEKDMEFQRKAMEWQQKVGTYEDELRRMQDEKMAPVIERTKGVVEAVSKQTGVEFTYDALTAPLYSKNSRDLTDAVIKEYDRRYK